ncbi:MAG: RNA polymerase sigma factor [Acidobacteriota bacterium]
MTLDDNELVMQVRNGNAAAFEELVRRYDRRVLSTALRYTGDREAAQDVYQEVFMRVHRAIDTFRFQSRFSTWLFRIVTNVCLTRQGRQRNNRHVPIEGESLREPGRDDGNAGNVPRQLMNHATPDQAALSSEIGPRIRSALAGLSSQQRMVFVLRHFEGYKLREIAELLDCAEGTVKKHLFTAVRKLREELYEIYC